MGNRLRTILFPALACLALAAPAFAAEIGKAAGVAPDAKLRIAKPGPGVGADEHGCIPPQIWHAQSGACVTDVLPDKGGKANATQKSAVEPDASAPSGKKHNYVGHVTLLR